MLLIAVIAVVADVPGLQSWLCCFCWCSFIDVPGPLSPFALGCAVEIAVGAYAAMICMSIVFLSVSTIHLSLMGLMSDVSYQFIVYKDAESMVAYRYIWTFGEKAAVTCFKFIGRLRFRVFLEL